MNETTSHPNTILNALRKISNISNASDIQFEKKLDQMLFIVLKSLNAGKGSIMILKSPNTLRVEASSTPAQKGMIQQLEENSASAWVVKHKKPLFHDAVDNTDDLSLVPDRYHKTAFMIAPMIYNNKVYGVISITEKIDRDYFTSEERDIFFDLAGHMISALEIYRLAESLKTSQQALSRKNQRLRQLEELRTDMFNMLVHDLKGPLSVIVANLDILSYTSNDDNMSYVHTARSGCEAMYRMISNLMDTARLEEGTLKLIVERLVPDQLLEEAVSGIKSAAEIKHISFIKHSSQTASKVRFFEGDRSLLLRVLQNLLMNAIRFSPDGKPVETGFTIMENDTVEFFVKDCGPGIPFKSQQNIFDKYVQIKNPADHHNDYTAGLGLTFSKMAVEAHKGTIRVESDEKSGSCFYFQIPLKKDFYDEQ